MDKEYWNSYYKSLNDELKPSLFAKYVMSNFIKDHRSLIELGCGNGRDAVYFANEKITVLAVDQCEDEIKFLKNRYKQFENIDFLSADFSNLDNDIKVDIVYSRFTLHSISKEQETQTLNWAYGVLNTCGYFCIEVRGEINEIYGKGEKVAGQENAYIFNGHYRRFLNFDELCNSLKHLGFTLKYASEEKGFAPFKGDDETFIRIIAQK